MSLTIHYQIRFRSCFFRPRLHNGKWESFKYLVMMYLHSLSVDKSSTALAMCFCRATSMYFNVWASDVNEWSSFNWHWVIRYSDRVSWVRVVHRPVSPTVHRGFIISIRATRDAIPSSSNWMKSLNTGTWGTLKPGNSVFTFCVDNCKHRW